MMTVKLSAPYEVLKQVSTMDGVTVQRGNIIIFEDSGDAMMTAIIDPGLYTSLSNFGTLQTVSTEDDFLAKLQPCPDATTNQLPSLAAF